MRLRNALILLGLFSFSCAANATFYRFQFVNYPNAFWYGEDPTHTTALCNAGVPALNSSGYDFYQGMSITHCVGWSGSTRARYMMSDGEAQIDIGSFQAVIVGDPCEADENLLNGYCVGPPEPRDCSAFTGQTIETYMTLADNETVAYGTARFESPDELGCSVTMTSSDCAGDTCKTYATYSGDPINFNSTGEFEEADKTAVTTIPQPQELTVNENTQTELTTDGTAFTETTTSTKTYPSGITCETVDGNYTCTNVPEQQVITTETTTTQPVPDPADANLTATETTTSTEMQICEEGACSTNTYVGGSTVITGGSAGKASTPEGLQTDCSGESCPEEPKEIGEQDWYEKTEGYSYESVMSTFSDRMGSAPITAAGSEFFTINVSGSCPTYSTTIAVFGTITFDQWCNPMMDSIWLLIQAILLASASFTAFRWAFL